MSWFRGRCAWSNSRQDRIDRGWTFIWSNNRQSWIERGWVLSLILASVAARRLTLNLPVAAALTLWGLPLLTVAILLLRKLLKFRRTWRCTQEFLQLYKEGCYKQALPLALELYERARREVGEKRPIFSASLNNLANVYHAMGDHVAALPLYRRALEISRAAQGEAHPQFATSLNNLAALYQAMGDHAAALPVCRQALEVRRAALGETHPDYAFSLNNLAMLYQAMGDYDTALPLHRQALEVRRAALGETHPDHAVSLNNLANLYQAIGNYAAALPLCRQALEICRAALGEAHPQFATNLNNLATLYQAMGDYAAALPLLRQAMEVRRTLQGEAHPHFADSLNNLATLYRIMGDHAAALRLCRQAREIYRAALDETHPKYAQSLNNLAMLYQAMGDYVTALPLHRQALEIHRAVLGETHPIYARSLNYLAILYHAMGDRAAALPLHRQALEVRRAALGETHPDYALSLNNLAMLYQAMGDYAAALPLCRQALEIYLTALGEAHSQLADILNNVALLYVAMGCPYKALPLMEQAAAIGDRMIGQVFSIGSERQRMGFLATLRVKRDSFLTVIWQHLSSSREAVGAGLSLVLRRKAVAADSLAAQRDAVLGNKYPNLRLCFQELAALRMQIAQKALAGRGAEGGNRHERLLKQWHEQKEQLEADLAWRIPEMKLEQKLRAGDRRAVALALPEGVALVEFVRFNVYKFKAVGAEPKWHSQRYLAFVLIAGDPDNVQMVDLGEAEPIDRLVADFRAGVTGTGERRDMIREPSKICAVGHPGERLRATVFDPLTNVLDDCRRLFLAPDGSLNWLPFEVLPTAEGRHLNDAYRFSYVSVGRDVLRFGVRSDRQAAEPLVAADPDFDLAIGTDSTEPKRPHGTESPPRQKPAPAPSVRPNPAPPAGRLSRDFDASRYHFSRLPGTRLEGERIAALLGVQPLFDQETLEGRLKTCHSPRIVHLATHGFFLPDQRHEPPQDFCNVEILGSGEATFARLVGPAMENPMLRSGLALAGANTFLNGGALPPEAEDGLLTAEDVVGLDLLDTDLVVLSACQTGIGEIQGSEGVFGLRRAFVVAGAKTLVMSLWSVPDLATTILMDRFYKNLLQHGMDRDLALRDAQGVVRKITVAQLKEQWLTGEMIDHLAAGNPAARDDLVKLAQRHDDHRPFEHPFYWGAFICQGDPSPLPRTSGEKA